MQVNYIVHHYKVGLKGFDKGDLENGGSCLHMTCVNYDLLYLQLMEKYSMVLNYQVILKFFLLNTN